MLPLQLFNPMKQVSDQHWRNAFISVMPEHRVCFAGACLPVSENRIMISSKRILDGWFSRQLKNLALADELVGRVLVLRLRNRPECMVKSEGFALDIVPLGVKYAHRVSLHDDD